MSDGVRGDSSRGKVETENPNKNQDSEGVRSDPLRDLLEWLEEFKENLVDDSVPEHRDAPSSSHELFSEPRAKVVSGEQSSTSPTMTSSTVSCDSETRAREDLSGTDSHPASMSSSHVERKERGDPLTKPTKNSKPIENETTRHNGATRCLLTCRNGCKNSEKILWMIEFLNAETHTSVLFMNNL